MTPAIETLFIENISVPANRRAIDVATVKTIAASIEKIGLRTPITIRSNSDDMAVLVAGAHRLEAAKSLGWDRIDCFVLDCSQDEADMWEISENLHRAELTVLQRSEQVAKWVELADRVSAQVGLKVGRPEAGMNKASRELNVTRQEVQRAVKVASLTDEAKEAARAAGIDDNQSALLAAARVAAAEQVAFIQARAAKPVSPPSNFPQDDHERSVKWRRSFERLWNDAPSLVDREWATDWMQRPIMDGAA